MATLALPVNIIYTLGCAFVSLIVLFLNPIIISVIYNDRQLRRQPSIIYIVNLALVDLCFAAVTFMTTLFRFLHLMTLYPLCLLLHLYLPFSLITASLLLMFTNSVDRFIFIRMSLKYHSIMNSRIAKRVALGIWIYSAAFPLLPYVICDHFWKYETCGQITATQTYRYLHIPLQATFFTTIAFTVLMFISVFRVVKKSRRLRHVPTRSSSMDSLSTTVSSPTLNASTPSLPPILELIPYEHEPSEDASACSTERSCVDSGFRQRRIRTESEQCCLPGTRDIMSLNTSLSGTRDVMSLNTNLPGTRDVVSLNANLPGTREVMSLNTSLSGTRDIMPLNANLPGTRDVMSLNTSFPGTRDVMSVHTSLQTRNPMPDLIMSQLWLDDAVENFRQETDNTMIDSVTERLFPDMRSNLRNREHFKTGDDVSAISVARRCSATPDLVNMSPDVMAESLDVMVQSPDMLTESHDEICQCFMRTYDVDEPDTERSVLEGGIQFSPDMSLVAMTPDETTALGMSASANLAIGYPTAPASNHEHCLLPAITRMWTVSKPSRKQQHSFQWNKKDGKTQLGPKINTFFKSQGYRIKSAGSMHSYRVKMKSTLPREPLEMLNFKLEKWGSHETITNSHLHENETSFSSTIATSQMSVSRNLASHRTPPGNILTSTHHNFLQLGILPPLRARRRSLSTSDNSSTVSIDSSSSFSHVTTESTVTSEGTTLGLQKTNSTTSPTPADPSPQDIRATLAQRTAISSLSDPTCDSNRRPTRDLPHRPRVLSIRADLRLSTRRPPLLRRLSSNNHNHNNILDAPRRPPTSFRRTYSRSISTLTTSSTSSVPFGSSSYSGRDIRTLKILFLMFCVYIMLWLPAFVIQVLRYLDYDVSIEITLIVYTLGISNSVFNFFVYPMRIPKLRVSFQKLFKSAIADAKRTVNRCTSVIKER